MKTTDVYNPEAFAARVSYAAQCFMRGTHSRRFDTCFEMGDGEAVVAALVRRADKNPTLKAAIAQGWADLSGGLPASWRETAARYAGKDLAAAAATLRNRNTVYP